ncbi:MAG: GspH/FimT family pseudopilin [Magnetococcus sp. YQC-5]
MHANRSIQRDRQPGFTLIELLITLAIVSALFALGMPYMSDAILNQKVKSAVTTLHQSLIEARSEAIKRNRTVTLTPTAGDWTNGWFVSTTEIDGRTMLLKNISGFKDLSITNSINGIVGYQNNGRLNTGTGYTSGIFYLSIANNTQIAMRCIVINLNGFPSIQTDTDGNKTNGCN